MKNLRTLVKYGFITIFLFDNALAMESPGHLNINDLQPAIEQLDRGIKDVCFISINFSDNEKEFFKKLQVKLSDDISFGKQINFQAYISFSEIEKTFKDSNYNKLKNLLITFFTDYTNANDIGKDYDINGAEFLSNLILEYSEKILDQENLAQKKPFLFVNVKAFKPNDAFQCNKRWHYDGRKGSHKADINLSGAFVGAPTIFAVMQDENRNKIDQEIEIIRNEINKSLDINKSSDKRIFIKSDVTLLLLKQLRLQAKESEQLKRILKELESINALEKAFNNITGERLKKDLEGFWRPFYQRYSINLFAEQNKIIDEIIQPADNQVALFTMSGLKPALHSEPDITVPRIFFGIRFYRSKQENLFDKDEIIKIVDLEDPKTY